ncbi:MAG TPA: hypothetical protein VFL93_10015 [Longimicrobiaceae bacterium]|nr:hypothetical protein [Longimicrobiaceae bacterium]
MSRRVARFWLSALGAAAVFAIAARFLLPYGALQRVTASERLQVWLLTLWCAGAMAICFGLAALLGHASPVGVKEVADAGSVTAAIEARRRARRGAPYQWLNFGSWLALFGALLIGIYFVAWGVTR